MNPYDIFEEGIYFTHRELSVNVVVVDDELAVYLGDHDITHEFTDAEINELEDDYRAAADECYTEAAL